MSDLISIVVPTYNESGNITTLVHQIDKVLRDRSYEIVIVDDDSPDGTAAKAMSLCGKYPVKAIVRKDKRGLASAVVEGFSHISGGIVTVMDADLQHPPEAIPGLISEIENGADVAVASRYVPGGRILGLNRIRKLVSKGATLVAHLLLPVTRDIKDPMSGFFAFNPRIVKDIDLKPIGFKILLEILTMRGVLGYMGLQLEEELLCQLVCS